MPTDSLRCVRIARFSYGDQASSGFAFGAIEGDEIAVIDGHPFGQPVRTGQRVQIQPQPAAGDPPLRWNWDSPLIISPADPKRIYFAVQLMYLDNDISTLRGEYFELVNDIVTAAPSCIPIVDEINNDILTGALYKALKAAKRLIQYEQDLLTNAAARG